MLKGGYSGIIIGACTEEDILHLEKMNPSMPVVLINRESEIFSTVSADNDLAGKIAADEFRRNGFTNAAVFASSVGYIASNYRVNSFISHCRDNGITVNDYHVMREAHLTAVITSLKDSAKCLQGRKLCSVILI